MKLRVPGPKRLAVRCGLLVLKKGFDWGGFLAGDFEGDFRGLGGYSSSIEEASEADGSGSDAGGGEAGGEASSSVSSPNGTGGAP